MKQHELVIIGAGPGGYVAAIRAAQLGMNVACVEKEPQCGGTCLRVGCIPSKALLESSLRFYEAQKELQSHGVKVSKPTLDLPTMLKRKTDAVDRLARGIEALFRKNGVTRYRGAGRFEGPRRIVVDGPEPVELQTKYALIASGSVSATLPGIELDGDRIGTSTEALSFPEVPKHLVVIGAGYIGLELGSVWLRLGARVTVLELLDRILPGTDLEVAQAALQIFRKQGFEFHLGARVLGARVEGSECIVEVEGVEPLRCDRVLVAVGRSPCTERLELERVSIETDKQGHIPVNDRFETSVKGVYAVGDVIVKDDGFVPPMLAHKAEDEGIACVEGIASGHCHINYDTIPAVCFTHPEIASVGKTEETLREAGTKYNKGTFPFLANSRARLLGHTGGFIKVLADAKTDRVLGVHILGPRAGDLIAEAAIAMEFGASSEDIARTCHAHPTLAEALKEAALAVSGRPINY